MDFDIYSFSELELLLISKDINIIPIFVIKETPENNILIFLYYIIKIENEDKDLKIIKVFSESDFNNILNDKDLSIKIFNKIYNIYQDTDINNEKFYYSIHSHKIDNLELSFIIFKPLHFLEVLKEIYSINGIIFNIIRDRQSIPIFEKAFYFDTNLSIIYSNSFIEQKIKSENIGIKKIIKDKRFSKPFLRTYYVNPDKFKKKIKINKEELINILQQQNDLMINFVNNFMKNWFNNIFQDKFQLTQSSIEKSNVNINKKNNSQSITINNNFNVIGEDTYDNLINVKLSHDGNINNDNTLKVSKNSIKISFSDNNVLNNKVISEIEKKLAKNNIDLDKIIDVIHNMIKRRKKEININIDYLISKEKIDIMDVFKIHISQILGDKELPYMELIINLLKEIKESEKIGQLILSMNTSKNKINNEVKKFINFLKISKYNLYKQVIKMKEVFKKDNLKDVYETIKKFVIELEKNKFITKEEKKFISAILKRVFKYYEVLLVNIHPIQYVLDNISPLSIYYGEKLIGIWFSTPQIFSNNTENNDNDNIDNTKSINQIYKKLILNNKNIDNLYNTILGKKIISNGIIVI